MRYGDLEMFLCGLELIHLLPTFQVRLHFILVVCEIVYCILHVLYDGNLKATQVSVDGLVGESMGGQVGVGGGSCEAVGC